MIRTGTFPAYAMSMLIAGAVFLLAFVSGPSSAFATVDVSPATFPRNIVNAVWTKAGGPYVVHDKVYLRNGTLTIEPGTVVKFAEDSWLSVHADVGLSINGTAEEPIYFTSLKDDTAGGDTNGDGSATMPAPGDWASASFGGGSVNDSLHVEHLKVRFGGGTTGAPTGIPAYALSIAYPWYVGVRATSYTLSNVEVAESAGVGLYLPIGESHSLRLSQSSFHDNASYALERVRVPNWMGFNDLAGALDARDNWWGDESGPKHPLNPSGSGDAIHPGYGSITVNPIAFSPWLTEFKGDDPYPVIIIPGILGSAQDENGTWVLDPITHIYDNLYETLDANGYTPEVDLFAFPYDWRKSNVETALLLRDKINQVQGMCHCGKVDLIAHSMGGLVSRQYIQSNYYENDVNHMIFLGTPHLGAPKAYLMWEGGSFGDDKDVLALILKSVLTLEAIESGYANLFQYVQLRPIESVRELLPVYSYLFDENDQLKIYPSQYPTNPFLENLSNTISSLFENVGSTHNIASDNGKDNTITSLDVIPSALLPFWPDGMPKGLLQPFTPLGISRGTGDGTVPLVSSESQFLASASSTASHSALPTSEQENVYYALTGKVATSIINEPQINRVLMIRIFSPADLTVADPLGRRVGRLGDSTVNEIPGAYYTGFNTDAEFITIPEPLDGEYAVAALGTGSGGAFTIAANYITDATSSEAVFVGAAKPDEVVESIAELDAAGLSPLTLHGLDEEPPVINVISPRPGDYLHSQLLKLDFNVSDEGTGVAGSLTLWDGEATGNDSIDLFFEDLGTHTFTVQATDRAGNATSTEVVLRVISTPSSTLSDVERAYELRWIKTKNAKKSLAKIIKKVIDIEKKISRIQVKKSLREKDFEEIQELREDYTELLEEDIYEELDELIEDHEITQDGFNVIRADVQWMLETL